MSRRATLAVVAALAAACAACGSRSTASGATADAAPGDSTTARCPPQPVATPTPSWIPPHALHANTCTAPDAAAITSCFVQGQSCNVAVSATCHACAISGDATPSSAALIIHDQSAGKPHELNIAGCVGALSGDPSAAGCGAKFAARDACIASACGHCTDPADLQTCAAQAATGVCATAAAGAQCATAYLAQCVQGTTDLEVGFNLVKLFCGP